MSAVDQTGQLGRVSADSRPAGKPEHKAGKPENRRGTNGATLAMPAAAAIASICAATAVSGVVGGFAWLSYVIVAVVVVAGAGVALRALRVPAVLVWLGEAFVLLCLTVTLFTNSGLLVVLPGPAALHDLGQVFAQAGTEVRTGVPPVFADQPIMCLIVLCIGLVAVAVDTLAVTARVPAAAGLILLCVYAVPASLDDQLLPWWSFVLGAAAFTMMLAVDGVARHQAWRGKLGLPSVASAGVAPAATAITTVAAVIALFVGATFTIIGTVGRLPGAAGSGPGGEGELGIKPFTVLQGMLDNKAAADLFHVTGLPASNPPYLRALTLSTFDASKGFVPDDRLPAGVAANGPLPSAPGQGSTDPRTKVNVQAVSWDDVWLPVFGTPEALQGIPGDYHYDRDTGIVYSETNRQPGNYTEQADLVDPSQSQLENAGSDYSEVDQKYRYISGVSQRVAQLAQQVTANAGTEFEKALAIQQYLHSPDNGFHYSTQTARPVSNDPLVDFLFYGKTGYCEQYSSAMAAMLRTLGIPVRVAIGFTDGFVSQTGGYRVISTTDAHAWDEVYFPGEGWVPFDPTPLADGRARTPSYLTANANGGNNPAAKGKGPDGGDKTSTPKASVTTTTAVPANAAAANAAGNTAAGEPVWQWWTLALLVLLALAASLLAWTSRRAGGGRPDRRWLMLALVCWGLVVFFAAALLSWALAVLVVLVGIAGTPAGIRALRRRNRLHIVAGRGPGAADAAWAELLDESWDRGLAVPASDTLRVAAHRMARDHGLDVAGRESLRTLIGAVERSWYGIPGTAGNDVRTALEGVLGSLRRNAPLALRARLLPRSVLRPAKTSPTPEFADEQAPKEPVGAGAEQ